MTNDWMSSHVDGKKKLIRDQGIDHIKYKGWIPKLILKDVGCLEMLQLPIAFWEKHFLHARNHTQVGGRRGGVETQCAGI